MIHHHGTKAALDIFNRVFSESNTPQLRQELQRLLQLRPPRTFTAEDRQLMENHNSLCFDITLINKIAGECRVVNFTCNGNAFQRPTGIRFSKENIPLLDNSTSGDHLTLIKDLRNTIFHWPNTTLQEQEFQEIWDFLYALLQRIGIDCIDLQTVRRSSFLNEDYLRSLLFILNERDREIGE